MRSTKGRKSDKDLELAQPCPKLQIPVVPREFLERPRLRKRLDIALYHKVILVSAPAGYGKTVFLSQALANANSPVAWLSLDNTDNDLPRFWASLIMALQKVQPGLGDDTLAMLRFGKPSIESALTELVNEIAEAVPHLIIVLDDYHEINAQPIHDSLGFLIYYLPPQVRLFISSRGTPPLSLTRVRGRGHIAEIRATDLQFTREETHSYLNDIMGLDLSKDQVHALHHRTEGWIAGLQMAALSIQEHRNTAEYVPAVKGTNKEIMEYLTKEVLDQQEEHVRSFLLQTCILDRLTESLCNAITGRDDSRQILEKLVAAHLFLQPLDEDGRWFRYHQLFGDLLRKQLEGTQPSIIPTLHRRASEWCESHEFMEDAVEHALAAKDFERAASLMQDIAFAVLAQDKHTLIQAWLARLPEEVVSRNPQICILGAFVCELLRQHEAGEPYRRYAQLMSEASKAPGQPRSAQADTTRGFLALIKPLSDTYDGKYADTIASLLDEIKSMPETETMARSTMYYTLGYTYWAEGELEASYRNLEESIRLSKLARFPFITIRASTALAHIRFARGHLNSAAEACREAIHLGTDSEGKESSIVCYARLLLGEILYQWNSLDESSDNIAKAVHLSEQIPEPVIHLNANMALARIAIARKEPDTAIEIARRARITHGGDVGQRFPSDVFLTRLWLMAGNLSAASDYAHIWSQFLSPSPSESAQAHPLACRSLDPPYNIQRGIYNTDIHDIWSETPLLTLIRLRIAQGELDGLLEMLDDICRDVETKGLTNFLIEALILKALVFHARRKRTQSLGTLEKLLAITENEGYVRVYVDEGQPMYQLLHRAASRGTAPLYVSRLLKAFNMPAPNTPGPPEKPQSKDSVFSRAAGFCVMTEPLTRREMEVLELMAAALPNREIAQKLVITIPTVKKHLRNIYDKLDVNNRSLAIIRAQETGLLKNTPTDPH